MGNARNTGINRREMFFGMAGVLVPRSEVAPEHFVLPDDDGFRLERKRAASRLTGVPVSSVTVTRWRPDTCACVVEWVWDESHMDKPVGIFSAAICEDHLKGGGSLRESALTAHRENVLKNEAVSLAVAHLMDHYLTARMDLKPDAEAIIIWGVEQAQQMMRDRLWGMMANSIQWKFDASRQMSLVLPPHHKAHAQTITAKLKASGRNVEAV